MQPSGRFATALQGRCDASASRATSSHIKGRSPDRILPTVDRLTPSSFAISPAVMISPVRLCVRIITHVTTNKETMMGLVFSKRKKVGKNATMNLSKSGVSISQKVGPLTINSRGKASIRLGNGLRFKF